MQPRQSSPVLSMSFYLRTQKVVTPRGKDYYAVIRVGVKEVTLPEPFKRASDAEAFGRDAVKVFAEQPAQPEAETQEA